MNKLIIVLSAKKQGGKSSLGKFIIATFLNKKIGKERFIIDKINNNTIIIDQFDNNKAIQLDYPNEDVKNISNTYSVKMYSFADPLKSVCTDILGLDYAQCYGTDEDKNSKTHILWDDIPYELRVKYGKSSKKTSGISTRKGPMSGREVMQILGTDIFRKMDSSCWSRALFNKIQNDGYELSVVADARFPNEITVFGEVGAKTVRLLRSPFNDSDLHESEKSLDSFPLGEYSLVLDNSELSLQECHDKFKPTLISWMKETRILA